MNNFWFNISISRLLKSFGLNKKNPPSKSDELLIVARTLLRVVDLIDHYTCSHSYRVAHYTGRMTDKMNFSAEQKQNMEHGALLHDVGKIGVGKKILCKNGPLTEEEWLFVKRHPAIGAEMLEHLGYSPDIQAIVRHHHENYDGSGYPDGLKGEEIPFIARVLAITDSFDAMTTNRPYSPARSVNEALMEIHRCSGTQFDPLLVQIVTQLIT